MHSMCLILSCLTPIWGLGDLGPLTAVYGEASNPSLEGMRWCSRGWPPGAAEHLTWRLEGYWQPLCVLDLWPCAEVSCLLPSAAGPATMGPRTFHATGSSPVEQQSINTTCSCVGRGLSSWKVPASSPCISARCLENATAADGELSLPCSLETAVNDAGGTTYQRLASPTAGLSFCRAHSPLSKKDFLL